MANESPRPAVLLRETLPTTKHATAFFDMLVARLGERAVVQTSNGGKNRALFVRAGGAGTFILPWPLLTLSISDPPEGELPDEDQVVETQAWTPGEPIDLLAFGWHPVPASVALQDGDSRLSVNYRWNGRWKDSCEPAERDAFGSLVPALSRASDNRLELLAEYVESIDVGRHGPARVLLPRPTPGGAEGAWIVGRAAIREAMHSRRTPGGSFWAVADGYVGKAIAFGASRDEALAAWRKEVERVRPKPPPPPDPSTLAPPDTAAWAPREWTPGQPEDPPAGIRFVALGWDAPPFDPSPASVPAAVVRVAALPAAKPPRGDWTRWLGDRGTTHFAVRLPIPGGYTLVGETLLPRFDLAAIDAALDALDEANPSIATGSGLPVHPDSAPRTHATVYYRCVDLPTGLPIDPRAEQSQIGAGFDARGFDGGRLRSHIVRVRRLE